MLSGPQLYLFNHGMTLKTLYDGITRTKSSVSPADPRNHSYEINTWLNNQNCECVCVCWVWGSIRTGLKHVGIYSLFNTYFCTLALTSTMHSLYDARGPDLASVRKKTLQHHNRRNWSINVVRRLHLSTPALKASFKFGCVKLICTIILSKSLAIHPQSDHTQIDCTRQN